MGIREFLGWIRVMNRQREGQRTAPDSWAGSEHDAGWAELRRERDRQRGR